MKITNLIKEDILARIEEIAKKIGQTANSLRQDPQVFAEELREGGSYLSSIFAPLFKGRARSVRPEFLRSQIKKEVKKNLVGRFHDEELVEAITTILISTAKEDPYYRHLLGLEKNVA